MNTIRSLSILSVLLLCLSHQSFAQGDIGPMQLDPTFAAGGIRTVSILGTTDDSVTCAIVFSRPSPDHMNVPVRSPILIGGKLLTAASGDVRFGIVRMDS